MHNGQDKKSKKSWAMQFMHKEESKGKAAL